MAYKIRAQAILKKETENRFAPLIPYLIYYFIVFGENCTKFRLLFFLNGHQPNATMYSHSPQ